MPGDPCDVTREQYHRYRDVLLDLHHNIIKMPLVRNGRTADEYRRDAYVFCLFCDLGRSVGVEILRVDQCSERVIFLPVL